MADVNLLAPKILAFEGGYEVDPADSGVYNRLGVLVGSNMGVTPNTYELVLGRVPTAQDMKDLTIEQFTKILKTLYWDKVQADKIEDQQVAEVIVDFAWGSGIDEVAKMVQGMVKVSMDGKIGPISLKAINSSDPQSLTNKIVNRRIWFYNEIVLEHPKWSKYLLGWVRRANSFTYQVPS